jgi:small nuclear ribonucleoprotein (snRNP)-like protein
MFPRQLKVRLDVIATFDGQENMTLAEAVEHAARRKTAPKITGAVLIAILLRAGVWA